MERRIAGRDAVLNQRASHENPEMTSSLLGMEGNRSFFDWLISDCKENAGKPFSLVAFDINNFKDVNKNFGIPAGDKALRWVFEVVSEETKVPAYRIGGDEFVLVLAGEHFHQHFDTAKRLVERFDEEGGTVNLVSPIASVAVIHFAHDAKISCGGVIGEIYRALDCVKSDPSEDLMTFHAKDPIPEQNLHRIVKDLADQLDHLADQLEQMHTLAHTDPLTGLPNARAAMQKLETSLSLSERNAKPLSILLIDGDDLSRYNEISYAAGDDMIKRLGATQLKQLRSGDFLGRWRMGDEFIVVMPSTSREEAIKVAERVRNAIESESETWSLPVTVSAGLAVYPEDGDTISKLLLRAENAKDAAKRQGKNRVAGF